MEVYSARGLTPKPPTTDIPNIEFGANNNTNFGYKVSVIRIEELDFNEQVITEYNLLNKTWNHSNMSDAQWKFNITLPNRSFLEFTFEYFKLQTNITFAKSSFIIPAESLKLSFTTEHWPFNSKLNTLRIVVQNDTLILIDYQECSINTPINTEYNQNVWSTIENPETGISVPYFKKKSIIDLDFSVLLTNSYKGETGICNKESSINWRVATGASIGAGIAVAAAGMSALVFRQRQI